MIMYWPQGEYSGNKGVKRKSLKASLDTFDAAVAQVNEWEQALHLLWAWVDVRSGQAKERVNLNKSGEEWSGVAPVIIDDELIDESAPGIPPESNKNPEDNDMENNTVSSRGKRYDDMTKRKAVAMIDEIGITKTARKLGIGIPTLNRWRKTIGSAADPEQKEAHPEPVYNGPRESDQGRQGNGEHGIITREGCASSALVMQFGESPSPAKP